MIKDFSDDPEIIKKPKWISAHSFRRSVATILNQKNERITNIKNLLRHKTLDMTNKYIIDNQED